MATASLKAHPEFRKLKRWCVGKTAAGRTIHSEYFRVAGPRHTTPAAIVNGVGGYKADGRWCRSKLTRLLYLSAAPETAMHESNEHARRRGLPLWNQMPKVTIAVRCSSARILDLTDAAVAADLPIALATMMAEDWRAKNAAGEESTTQVFGRAARASGFEGLLVPSAPDPSGTNLVLFLPGPTVVLLNPDALKALGTS